MITKLIGAAILATISISVFADEPPAADATPLAKYRCYTQDVVTPLWYREMAKNNFGGFRYSEVRIRCRVHSDGTVSDMTVVVGESAGLLKTVSLHVLQSAAPFKPFDPALIAEMGTSYVDEFSFKVVSKATMTAKQRNVEGTAPMPSPD